MSQYTVLLDEQAETLSPDADDYEERLLEIATMFRGFGAALTSFIEEHGYAGDSTDIKAKAAFLRERFKAANVKQPRDFKEWFSPNAEIKRFTAYTICFAFGLDVPATNEFFQRVRMERGFDCHTISEAVYYFCIRNGLSYEEAQGIIRQIPNPGTNKALPDQDIRYTGTIIHDIDGMDNSDALIEYITRNISDFRYNNATAIKYIRELWAEISGTGGLAVCEGHLIDGFNREEVRSEDFVIAKDNSSTWTIFSQILGLTNDMESEFARKYDRSLAKILSQNALMPLKSSYCFPSQHSIDRVLRGEMGDNEMMRKLLVFLVFYTYWARLIIGNKDADYEAKRPDADRCLETINNRLLDAGYPTLYSGNPYDWLFLWSLNDDHPLRAFRSYMGEVFTFHAERLAEVNG